jgi:hypothetical protein
MRRLCGLPLVDGRQEPVVICPIASWKMFVNQTVPSGPDEIPFGYALTAIAVSARQMTFATHLPVDGLVSVFAS